MKKNKPNFYILAAAIVLLVGLTGQARSAVMITMSESGADVVATGFGTLNLTAWTAVGAGFITDNVNPALETILLGTSGPDVGDFYQTPLNFSSPGPFGAGGGNDASNGTGNFFGMLDLGGPALAVPGNYISGSPLSGTMSFDNVTLASLGIQQGSYVWSWGTGQSADSLTLNVIPEPSTGVLLSIACLGIAIRRRR